MRKRQKRRECDSIIRKRAVLIEDKASLPRWLFVVMVLLKREKSVTVAGKKIAWRSAVIHRELNTLYIR